MTSGAAHPSRSGSIRTLWPTVRLGLLATLFAAVMAGCSSTSHRKGGGYYEDDGPEANPPSNLDAVPDAVPRIEPLASGPNKPYVVFGKRYVPDTDDDPFVQHGIASWYGKKFHNKNTSSGEPYNMYAMTAAHPTLPIPSYARVTSAINGKSVIVKVNDRGPFHSSRIMDLSYAAAYKLGILGPGSGEVTVEHITNQEVIKLAAAREAQQRGTATAAAAPAGAATAGAVAGGGMYAATGATTDGRDTGGAMSAAGGAMVGDGADMSGSGASDALLAGNVVASGETPSASPGAPAARALPPIPVPAAPAQGTSGISTRTIPAGTVVPVAARQGAMRDAGSGASGNSAGMGGTSGGGGIGGAAGGGGIGGPAGGGGVYLQLGAFSQAANAQSLASRVNGQLGALGVPAAEVSQSNSLFKVRIGPYADRQAALAALQTVSDHTGIMPSVATP
jgi:rare lipoprotein A